MERYELLERRWAEFNDLDPAGMVACSSGTAALCLAFEALELPRGSQIVMSDYNMIACPRAAVMAGLVPVFVDCDDKLLLDTSVMRPGPGGVKNRNTSAVLATHIYGRRCNMNAIVEGAEPRFLSVVEDLAEAHGVKVHPSTDAACWSHYKNKLVGGEEGGTVWFRNPLRAKLARKLRCLGFTDDHDYTHIPRGHNYRLANSLADRILLSLARYRENLDKRREIEALHDLYCPTKWKMPARQVPWVYDIRIPGMTKELQDRIVKVLKEEDIQARHGFKPMTWQKEFFSNRPSSPNAYRAATEVIYLPLDPFLHPNRAAHAERCWQIIYQVVGSIPQEKDA